VNAQRVGQIKDGLEGLIPAVTLLVDEMKGMPEESQAMMIESYIQSAVYRSELVYKALADKLSNGNLTSPAESNRTNHGAQKQGR
jgi:hypothetical protein